MLFYRSKFNLEKGNFVVISTNYTLSQQLGFILRDRKLKLVVAESCTAGGLSENITAVPGSSEWFDRGFVTYSNDAKIELLGVRYKTLEKHGAVSEEVAMEMAKGSLYHSHADISLSITGIAGPGGGTPEKPVGTVWFALAHRNGYCKARLGQFTSGRNHVRSSAISFALHWLLEYFDNRMIE